MKLTALALGVALALATTACGKSLSRRDCERATDHMIDIFAAPHMAESKEVPQELSKAAEEWKKALKSKDPLRGSLVDTCRKQMTASSVSCVLGANDESALAKCFGG